MHTPERAPLRLLDLSIHGNAEGLEIGVFASDEFHVELFVVYSSIHLIVILGRLNADWRFSPAHGQDIELKRNHHRLSIRILNLAHIFN